MTEVNRGDAIQTPEQARQALVATLNAIEDKLNVPKRARRAADRGRIRLRRAYAQNPPVVLAGTAAVALAAGVAVWGLVRVLGRR